jgi:molecular chaperone GrpE
MLPVLDNLRRALAAAAAAGDPLVEGLQRVVREFEEVLAAHGVVPVETVGRPFHPGMHEAVHTEESTNLPEDTVTSELRTGYRLHDRVLRPAQVAVSRRPADGGSQGAGVSDRGR